MVPVSWRAGHRLLHVQANKLRALSRFLTASKRRQSLTERAATIVSRIISSLGSSLLEVSALIARPANSLDASSEPVCSLQEWDFADAFQIGVPGGASDARQQRFMLHMPSHNVIYAPRQLVAVLILAKYARLSDLKQLAETKEAARWEKLHRNKGVNLLLNMFNRDGSKDSAAPLAVAGGAGAAKLWRSRSLAGGQEARASSTGDTVSTKGHLRSADVAAVSRCRNAVSLGSPKASIDASAVLHAAHSSAHSAFATTDELAATSAAPTTHPEKADRPSRDAAYDTAVDASVRYESLLLDVLPTTLPPEPEYAEDAYGSVHPADCSLQPLANPVTGWRNPPRSWLAEDASEGASGRGSVIDLHGTAKSQARTARNELIAKRAAARQALLGMHRLAESQRGGSQSEAEVTPPPPPLTRRGFGPIGEAQEGGTAEDVEIGAGGDQVVQQSIFAGTTALSDTLGHLMMQEVRCRACWSAACSACSTCATTPDGSVCVDLDQCNSDAWGAEPADRCILGRLSLSVPRSLPRPLPRVLALFRGCGSGSFPVPRHHCPSPLTALQAPIAQGAHADAGSDHCAHRRAHQHLCAGVCSLRLAPAGRKPGAWPHCANLSGITRR